MEVRLTPEQERFIAIRVQSGRFESAEEVVQTALALLEEQEARYDVQPAMQADLRKLNLVEIFAPLRGANLEFPRDKSLLRPFDL